MYLSYEKYKELGGTLNDTTFLQHETDIETKLDYLTNGRIKKLDTVPEAVINLCFKLNISFWEQTEIDGVKNITSYSNGIESFSYGITDSQGKNIADANIIKVVNEYLWEYPELLYRGKKQWMHR